MTNILNGTQELVALPLKLTVFEVEHTLECVVETADALRDNDCVLFEWLGGSQEQRQHDTDILNAITAGQYTDEELAAAMQQTDNFVHHLTYALRSSGILFLPIDTPNDTNSGAWRFHQAELAAKQSAIELLENDPANVLALQALLHYRARQAAADGAREEHMLTDIQKHLERINKHPRLRAQIGSVGIVVGQAHETVYQELHRMYPQARKFVIPTSSGTGS